MGKRGAKPKGRVVIVWSANIAYAIGLLVTDGCISSNKRHITFVSKDRVQLRNFMKALKIRVPISYTTSSYTGKKIPRVQFGDILFCNFLMGIGLMPNKTKIIGKVVIPHKYFFDFLRGHLDGDGCTYSYWDPRWKSSFMFYTTFVSASRLHILWLREEIFKKLAISGHITGKGEKHTVYQLKYAKKGSLLLLRKMYHTKNVLCLPRKRLKIEKMLGIVGEQL